MNLLNTLMHRSAGSLGLAFLLVAASAQVQASNVSIVPKPQSITEAPGSFTLSAATCMSADPMFDATANYLRDALIPATEFNFPLADNTESNCINFKHDESLPKEGYRLTVSDISIDISASTATGAFYAVQSLRQLLPAEIYAGEKRSDVNWSVGAVKIEDAPRFEWRGMHLDVGRHFMPTDFIKKFIDALAVHKINKFHWHLTEDQGWRIEIKQYPKLTEVGAWRDGTQLNSVFDGEPDIEKQRYGGFYSQEEVREVVAYAQSRHITIIPEIEMPGHAQAAIAAYPELGNTGDIVGVRETWGISDYTYNVEDSTFTFLENVLTEVMDLFPGEYIHIGGDEAPKKQWDNSPAALAKMKALGLKDGRELQNWFVNRINDFLTKNGRKLVGWDEILQGGTVENATVMSWRGQNGGIKAARAGLDVVMADVGCFYFDQYQASRDVEPLAMGLLVRLEDTYGCDPIPDGLTEEESRRILGAQGQLWTEFVRTPEHAEYMMFPRLSALSEVVWTNPQLKNYDDFVTRMDHHTRRLDQLDINYRPLGNDEISWFGKLKLWLVKRMLSVYFWFVE